MKSPWCEGVPTTAGHYWLLWSHGTVTRGYVHVRYDGVASVTIGNDALSSEYTTASHPGIYAHPWPFVAYAPVVAPKVPKAMLKKLCRT